MNSLLVTSCLRAMIAGKCGVKIDTTVAVGKNSGMCWPLAISGEMGETMRVKLMDYPVSHGADYW